MTARLGGQVGDRSCRSIRSTSLQAWDERQGSLEHAKARHGHLDGKLIAPPNYRA
ncbi:hypothetical protein [Pectobacterium actinidiae]|uniref:hypothetical protein n=1 Tax=Pectobacterium actinidiae TaxID=1507808 RepID=UPI00381DCC3D